jgi:hypothetical protein
MTITGKGTTGMKENHRLRYKRKQKIQERELFSILLYMQEMINRGTYKDDDFNEVVKKNVCEHGHDWFRPPKNWKDDVSILINKYGWRIFEAHKAGKKTKPEEEVNDGH